MITQPLSSELKTLTTGILLAGGMSRRMGTDKAALPWGEGTLLTHKVQQIKPHVDEILIITANEGRYNVADCRTVRDLYPQEGPLGGLLTGLSASNEGWHWLTACDMPFLVPEVLRLLQSKATSEVQVVVPEIAGRLEPLFALYHSSALEPLQKAFNLGERALHRAILALPSCVVSSETLRMYDTDLTTFENLNTIEEYHHAQKKT